jgi:hypothetical protein
MHPVLRGVLHSIVNVAVFRVGYALPMKYVVLLSGLALVALMCF